MAFNKTSTFRLTASEPCPQNDAGAGNLHATFVLNFFDELRRMLPVGK